MAKVLISLRLEKGLFDLLKKAADEAVVSVSEVIRLACAEAMDLNKQKQAARRHIDTAYEAQRTDGMGDVERLIAEVEEKT